MYLGLLGSGEEVGMEVVHDNIREQRRSGEVTRAAESQKRRVIRLSDHHPTTGLRQRSQVMHNERIIMLLSLRDHNACVTYVLWKPFVDVDVGGN